MQEVTELPPAGWYPDALDPAAHRWWDGSAWTTHVLPPQAAATVAVAEPVSSQENARRAAGYEPRAHSTMAWHATEPTVIVRGSAQSLSGWFLALSPLWYGGVTVFVGMIPGMDRTATPIPSLVVSLILLFGLALTDGKRLVANGYRPTSPGWVLLPLVYFILRTVRTGSRGVGMLVAFVLSQVLILAIAVLFVLATLPAASTS